MSAAAPFGQGATRRLLQALRALIVCALVFVCSHTASAQVFELTGGSSSLLNAQGGSFEIHAPNYTGRLDLGYIGRPSFGLFLSRPFKKSLIGAGDQQIPFLLPTDLFDHWFYFIGRGASLSRKMSNGNLFVFGGTTSNGYIMPFLNVARRDTTSSAVFYERQLSSSLRFFSHNIFSKRQTSIQAVEWTARKDIKVALSAGLGNNQPYWASSFTLAKHWMSLDASYARSGDSFRRVLVTTPQLSENDRENIRLELTPLRNVRIVVSRNNYLSSFASGMVERAAVEGFGAGAGIRGLQMYGSLFRSSTSSGDSTAEALGVRRMFTRHFEAGVDFLRSAYSQGTPSRSVVTSVREILNSRFSLTQIISRNSGQTNVSFGGNFVSNFVSVSVDYQTVFLPFVQNIPGQFKQIIVLGLHFQLPHGVQFNMATNVTPLGQVGYTAYASTYAYHGMGPDTPGASFSGAFFHNIVRGNVVDIQGEPIAGAAIRIGGDLAVTDSEGNFLIRLKKAGDLNLQVAFDDFTAPGSYVTISAPATVRAGREEESQEYKIILKRVPDTLSAPNLLNGTPEADAPIASN